MFTESDSKKTTTIESTDSGAAPAAATREYITTLKTGIQRSEEFQGGRRQGIGEPAMRSNLVVIPTVRTPITPCPGFLKKLLADYKLDLLGLCQFGCLYCSSPTGNYLRIRREEFAGLTEEQTGARTYPLNDPSLCFLWDEIIPRIEIQLATRKPTFGIGEVIVVSMLTDPFSPVLLQRGVTRRALELILAKTSFRIRLLTKSATVGSAEWIRFLSEHPERFVVGLSMGTLDDAWARRFEPGVSPPSARLRALHRLQAAGIPTFGMLCPVFPEVLHERGLENLVEAINPGVVETVWAEPFNDRDNWKRVRDRYPSDSQQREELTRMFGKKKGNAAWSRYATELYVRLHRHAVSHRWQQKLAYLLYEGRIAPEDARAFHDLDGVLLQGKPAKNGLSMNKSIAALQRKSALDISGR
jgi:DNA repair photolyase